MSLLSFFSGHWRPALGNSFSPIVSLGNDWDEFFGNMAFFWLYDFLRLFHIGLDHLIKWSQAIKRQLADGVEKWVRVFSLKYVFIIQPVINIWATALKPHFYLFVKIWHLDAYLWVSCMSYISLHSKLRVKERLTIHVLKSHQHYLYCILKMLNFTCMSNKNGFVNHVSSRLVKLL